MNVVRQQFVRYWEQIWAHTFRCRAYEPCCLYALSQYQGLGMTIHSVFVVTFETTTVPFLKLTWTPESGWLED